MAKTSSKCRPCQLLERILSERRKKWEATDLTKMIAKGKIQKNDKWKGKYTQ